MTKRKNLTILSVAGLTSALAIGAFGGSVGAEESGTQYAIDQTYDEVGAGARLLLAFDPESNAFGGLVENTTDGVLDQVRVEVHLSNGTELGPTTPTDLAPGEIIEVVLPATDEPFDSFSAHPEVGLEDDEGSEYSENEYEDGEYEEYEDGEDEEDEEEDNDD